MGDLYAVLCRLSFKVHITYVIVLTPQSLVDTGAASLNKIRSIILLEDCLIIPWRYLF